MRPKSAMFYIDALEDIADDFIEFVRRDVQGSEDGLTNRQVANLVQENCVPSVLRFM